MTSKPQRTPFDLCFNAVRSGDLDYLRHHLGDSGLDVNQRYHDVNKSTMLHKACNDGNAAVVRLLLEDPHVLPNLRDGQEQTPLLCICTNGNVHVLEVLLEFPTVEVNLPDRYGATPLWWAARLNHVEVVRKMLQTKTRKIDLNVRSAEVEWDEEASKTTALQIAQKKGNTEIVDLLTKAIEAKKAEAEGKPSTPTLEAKVSTPIPADSAEVEELHREVKALKLKLGTLENRSGKAIPTYVVFYYCWRGAARHFFEDFLWRGAARAGHLDLF